MRPSPVIGVLAIATALVGCSTSAGTPAASSTETTTANASSSATSETTASTPSSTQDMPSVAQGALVTADGANAGRVTVSETEGGLQIVVEASGLTPGFHGLHVHEVGKCEPKSLDPKDPTKRGDFLSSGGHLDTTGADHPGHDGDLPSLYVGKDGSGRLNTVTERLTSAALTDADGTALLVHALPDNAANIPTRYAANGPDAETKKAGDSGPRVACAALAAP